MSKQPVLVSGAGGFIGKPLVHELAQSGYRVLACVRRKTSFPKKNIRTIQSDLISPIRINSARPDAIIHLAVRKPGEKSDLMKTLRANLLPLKSILQYAKDKEVPHVIYCSSGLVYKPSNRKVAEDSETGPQSDYALAKLLGETLCKPFEMENRFVVTIIRFSHIYGPGEGTEGTVGPLIENARKGKTLRMPGKGNERLDCLYLQDVLRAFHLVLKKKPSGVLNVGSGSAYSLKTIAHSVSKTFGGKGRISSDAKNKENRPYFCLDIRRVEQAIGFQPEYDLKSGLAHYKQFMK